MAEAPIDTLLREEKHQEAWPPLRLLDHLCIWAGALVLLWGTWIIIDNWSDLAPVVSTQTSSAGQSTRSAPRALLWVLQGTALGLYLLLLLLSRFPHLYNYPFKLQQGEERVVFPIARSAMHILNLETTLLLVLINWEIIRTGVGLTQSFSPWSVFAVTGLYVVTIVWLFTRLTCAHKQYTPPAPEHLDSAAS